MQKDRMVLRHKLAQRHNESLELEKKIGVKLALKSPEEQFPLEDTNNVTIAEGANSVGSKFQFSAEMSVQQA